MKVAVIVQCRLSSTRLPRKALLKLDDKVLLSYALKSMSKVKADEYYVACDYDSEVELAPIAKKNGFKLFAGSKEDVLERFCRLIEKINVDVVVRATADNPFLFFEAATESLDLYLKKYYGTVDYFTYSGLPHGSGVEIFNAHSLVKAKDLTDLSYDHEHVGPSLYNHAENFKSIFYPAPKKFNYPKLRTTIDTYADFLRATDAIKMLKLNKNLPPYNCEDILKVFSNDEISKKILYIPSIKKTQGTGHFRRCVELAKLTNGAILIDKNVKEKIDYQDLLKDFDSKKVIKENPLFNEYDLIVCDMFKMTKQESMRYTSFGKTLLLDEGSKFTNKADFLLNIIPSKLQKTQNLQNPLFIPSPRNKKENFFDDKTKIKKILICFGGEDSKNLTQKFIKALENSTCNITAVTCKKDIILKKIPEQLKTKIKIEDSIFNLKEKLFEYDLVITHYGFTAFECVYSNTPVLLAAPSRLHKKLSDTYGFTCITLSQITEKKLNALLTNIKNFLPKFKFDYSKPSNLSSYVLNIANAKKYDCPICKNQNTGNDKIVERTEHHTFRKCSNCSINYIAFSDDSEVVKYEKSYFADEYKKQYGKTYLEDFESIKKSCVNRVKNIDKVLKIKDGSKKNILDIGCAYGPFLSAAFDDNWTPFGSDIAEDAINYVKNNLKFNAINASFADLNIYEKFGIEKLDAITMWYVIEHIKDLKNTLSNVNKLLLVGGIFAFSTPNASGLSCKVNKKNFYCQSPKDHYSLWELKNTNKYLKRFGFKVIKIVPSGVHPERLPFIKKYKVSPNSLIFRLCKLLINLTKNGDTYEVYCKKISECAW